ncbi:hypothetical protein OSTOST_15549 [Ostertagia ostertagi]
MLSLVRVQRRVSQMMAKTQSSSARRLKLAASIRSFVDRLSFNGVELRCADLLTKSTKIQFAHFLRVLNKEMSTNQGAETCGNYCKQCDLCQRLKYAGTVRQTHWDSMSVSAWTTGGRWISIDDQHTVKYKMRYSLREGLAGVGLMSLNEDDHMGTCGSGAFPILRSITAKCH